MNRNDATVCATHPTPLGPVLLLAGPKGLAGLWFEAQRHHPAVERMAHWTRDASHPVLLEARHQLDDYFAASHQAFTLPLDLGSGSAFQQAVWQALLRIPRGQTRSYREIAEQLGRPQAVRAVGAAVGRNPLSIVVPCHRVLGSDGGLTGYAGGLERKRALLQLEAL